MLPATNRFNLGAFNTHPSSQLQQPALGKVQNVVPQFGSTSFSSVNIYSSVYKSLSFADKALLWTLCQRFNMPSASIKASQIETLGGDGFVASRLQFFSEKGLLKCLSDENTSTEKTYKLCPQALAFLKDCPRPGSDLVMTPEKREEIEVCLNGLTTSELKALQRLPIFPNRVLERDLIVALMPNYLEQVKLHNALARAQVEITSCLKRLSADDLDASQFDTTLNISAQKQSLIHQALKQTQQAAEKFQQSLINNNAVFSAANNQMTISEAYQVVANEILAKRSQSS